MEEGSRWQKRSHGGGFQKEGGWVNGGGVGDLKGLKICHQYMEGGGGWGWGVVEREREGRDE